MPDAKIVVVPDPGALPQDHSVESVNEPVPLHSARCDTVTDTVWGALSHPGWALPATAEKSVWVLTTGRYTDDAASNWVTEAPDPCFQYTLNPGEVLALSRTVPDPHRETVVV